MIEAPSGKLISKATAVLMLKEACIHGVKLSKDRLSRIEQCAVSATRCAEQLDARHHGTQQLELFQDVALAFNDGPTGLHVEFGRIQKMVTRGTGKGK